MIIIFLIQVQISFAFIVIQSNLNQYITSNNPPTRPVQINLFCAGGTINAAPQAMTIWANNCNPIGPGQLTI
jgi:hypothetical protein